MQVTAIVQNGGLFIPNIAFDKTENQLLDVNIDFDSEKNQQDRKAILQKAVGIMQGIDGTEYQNQLRSEWR